MRNQRSFLSMTSLGLFFVLISVTASCIQGQIKFTDAFPGLKLNRPVYFGVFPGKAKTYVVLEQHNGNVLLISQKGNAWVKDTLLNLEVHWENEMGLLGIAFHPDFVNNRRYFISYDPNVDFFNIVEERSVDATLLKDSGKKGVQLFNIPDKYRNHNGGTLLFGPDGLLYFGTGDGGLFNDPDGNGQNKDVLLGKILRIDVSKKDTIKINGKDSVFNYGIPPTNPFAISGGRKEIYAYGLRNPWKFSFDPLTGDLWVGDVGQGTCEEVDIVTAGGNYGWKAMEGPIGTNSGSMILPVFSYVRAVGLSVTGGEVYRAVPSSKYYGSYFVGDYGTAKFWSLKKNGTGLATVKEEGNLPPAISSFGKDEFGRIYACALYEGKIYLLDSPDLGPGPVVTTSIPDFSNLPHRHVFHTSSGSMLDAKVFSGKSKLEIFSVEGGRIASLNRGNLQLPKSMGVGVYLIRNANTVGDPDLLVVH